MGRRISEQAIIRKYFDVAGGELRRAYAEATSLFEFFCLVEQRDLSKLLTKEHAAIPLNRRTLARIYQHFVKFKDLTDADLNKLTIE